MTLENSSFHWKWNKRDDNNNNNNNNKNVRCCKIATHFIDKCCDKEIFKYLAFVIEDVVNNTSGLTLNQIENLLLEKEKFCIGTLVTQHQSLNSTHDWNCSKGTGREKINN